MIHPASLDAYASTLIPRHLSPDTRNLTPSGSPSTLVTRPSFKQK